MCEVAQEAVGTVRATLTAATRPATQEQAATGERP